MNTITRRDFIKVAAAAAVAAPYVARGAASPQAGFEIGLVADAQFADVEPKGTRYYRASPRRLGEAVEHFNGRDLSFCVNLGDLIDHDWKSFDEITKPLAGSRHRFHHLLGNHDFEVLAELKARVPGRLGMEKRYSYFDHRGFRFAVLDTNDVSTYAHAPNTPEHAAATAELARLEATNLPQAKPWNGAVGETQFAWLDRLCREAGEQRLKVILLAHHPLLPAATDLLWNASEVLALIARHPHVVAWLNGHNHRGALAEAAGVPLLTMHGMVETPDTTAFATARILNDRMIIAGHGRELSREFVFRKTG
jgi:hypothetical protein